MQGAARAVPAAGAVPAAKGPARASAGSDGGVALAFGAGAEAVASAAVH